MFKTPLKFNGLECPNRILRSSTALQRYYDIEGYCKPEEFDSYIKYHQEIAKNCGIFMSEHLFTHRRGIAHIKQVGIGYKAGKTVEACEIMKQQHTQLIKAMKEANPKVICFAQLANAGIQGIWELDGTTTIDCAGDERYKPFEVNTITEDDMKEIIEGFVSGAKMAKEAGYDGVEIHSAHGYFLNQSISPLLNKRFEQDDVEGRYKFMLEKVLKAVRKEVGENYPIAIKLECEEFVGENGITAERGLRMAEMVAKEVCLIEISGGLLYPKYGGKYLTVRSGTTKSYYVDISKKMKELPIVKERDVKICCTGGFNSSMFIGKDNEVDKYLEENYFDIVGLSRQYIKNVNWYENYVLKEGTDIEECKKCVDCKRCCGCVVKTWGKCVFNK